MSDIVARVQFLRELLEHHNFYYFVLSSPFVFFFVFVDFL